MSFLGAHTIPKLGFGVSTKGFLDFLLGGIGMGVQYCHKNMLSEHKFENTKNIARQILQQNLINARPATVMRLPIKYDK